MSRTRENDLRADRDALDPFDDEAPPMLDRIVIDRGVLRYCWLASLAYACGWKRAGKSYLLDAQILLAS